MHVNDVHDSQNTVFEGGKRGHEWKWEEKDSYTDMNENGKLPPVGRQEGLNLTTRLSPRSIGNTTPRADFITLDSSKQHIPMQAE